MFYCEPANYVKNLYDLRFIHDDSSCFSAKRQKQVVDITVTRYITQNKRIDFFSPILQLDRLLHGQSSRA